MIERGEIERGEIEVIERDGERGTRDRAVDPLEEEGLEAEREEGEGLEKDQRVEIESGGEEHRKKGEGI